MHIVKLVNTLWTFLCHYLYGIMDSYSFKKKKKKSIWIVKLYSGGSLLVNALVVVWLIKFYCTL